MKRLRKVESWVPLTIALSAMVFAVALLPFQNMTTSTNSGAITNGTGMPTTSINFSIFDYMPSYISSIISCLAWLYKLLKDRNWKKKYDGVVVARKFNP